MVGQIIVAAVTLFFLFVLFLVISKTMNNMINLLLKSEYLFQKEIELKNEALEVHMIMQAQTRNKKDLVTMMKNNRENK
ncbi:MAG: hypothetical protein GX640_23935 [Fibrobacter sp.]|nr:hypothetical protein [Fibrobacter sp.]